MSASPFSTASISFVISIKLKLESVPAVRRISAWSFFEARKSEVTASDLPSSLGCLITRHPILVAISSVESIDPSSQTSISAPRGENRTTVFAIEPSELWQGIPIRMPDFNFGLFSTGSFSVGEDSFAASCVISPVGSLRQKNFSAGVWDISYLFLRRQDRISRLCYCVWDDLVTETKSPRERGL